MFPTVATTASLSRRAPSGVGMILAMIQYLVFTMAVIAVLLSASMTGEREIVMNMEGPSPLPQQTAMTIAQHHALERGMTSCGDPAEAELSDTILALPSDASGMPVPQADLVQELDLDGALSSAEHNRMNLLACAP